MNRNQKNDGLLVGTTLQFILKKASAEQKGALCTMLAVTPKTLYQYAKPESYVPEQAKNIIRNTLNDFFNREWSMDELFNNYVIL